MGTWLIATPSQTELRRSRIIQRIMPIADCRMSERSGDQGQAGARIPSRTSARRNPFLRDELLTGDPVSREGTPAASLPSHGRAFIPDRVPHRVHERGPADLPGPARVCVSPSQGAFDPTCSILRRHGRIRHSRNSSAVGDLPPFLVPVIARESGGVSSLADR